MGLPLDNDLQGIGVTSHALEDYLIMLLLLDECLRPPGLDLRGLLAELASVISNRGIPFDSSKELFQVVKPIVKHGFSDTGMVRELFRNADSRILSELMAPLVVKLEEAASQRSS